MSNLEKELISTSNKKKKEMSSLAALTQVQLLIAEKGADDLETLRAMGMHHSVVRAQNIRAAQMEFEQLEAKYGKVFTISEIKEVACTYALKFLRTDKYKGNIDPLMLQKMREFFKDSGIDINKAKLGYDFFVLAPSKAFNLDETPRPPKKDPDPILFYKIDETHYRMIHKWGRDLTMFRKFLGFKYRSEFNFFLVWFASMFIPAFLLFNNIMPKSASSWWGLLFAVPAIVIALIRVANDDWGGTYHNWIANYQESTKAKF